LGFQLKPDKRSALDRFFCKRVRACLQSFSQPFLKVREAKASLGQHPKALPFQLQSTI